MEIEKNASVADITVGTRVGFSIVMNLIETGYGQVLEGRQLGPL